MDQKEGYIPVKGGKVWYQISGTGADAPLLFLHGGPGFPSYSFECLKEIGKQRPIIFYHQLGAGKSDRPDDNSLWVFDRFVDELETVVKELKLKKFHLLGHSWGGALAVGYTLKHQDKVKSLLLLSPFLSTKKWLADANRLKKNLPKEMQIIIENNEKSGTTNSKDYKKAEEEFSKRHWCRLSPLPESILKGIREGNSKIYQTMWGPSEFHCTGNLKNLDLTVRLPELKMPVLFACGRYDEATPETILEFQKLVPGSKIVIFEKSAHRAEVEEKEKFVSTTRKFLNEVDQQYIK
ncbi:MAG: proline iminopeptidase-family hydrolase [Candidatus Levybacteria bacterium]|nr:proline iminopeptidase-family hydrolase [Candidatus Levybacteria bacterium]